jgi:hypothetical protein
MVEIFDKEEDSPVYLSLVSAGCDTDVSTLETLTEQQLKGLSYELKDSKGATKTLPAPALVIAGLLLRWKSYLTYRASLNDPLFYHLFHTLSRDEFDEYIYNVFSKRMLLNIPQPPSAGPITSTPADLFRKSIKRDSAVYPVLKQDSQFDSWNRETLAFATAQDCHNVFDPNYTPQGRDEVDLFHLQKNFIYSIFVSNLQTDIGRKLVRNNTDPQYIYAELVEYYEKSNRASLDGAQLLEYVTSVRLDETWRGTTQAFVLHLQEQFRQLRRVTPPSDHLSLDVERALVENAVRAVPALHMVKTQAKTIQATSRQKLDSDSYFTLLIDAAIEHDNVTAAPSKLRRNAIRSAHVHEIDHASNYGEDFYNTNSSHGLDNNYNIDTPIDVIQSYVHARNPRHNNPPQHLTSSKLDQMSEAGREMWMKMTPEDRAIIFDLKGKSNPTFTPSPRVPGQASGRPPDRQPPSRRTANLHEISAYDFIVMQHELNQQHVADSTPATPKTSTTSNNGNSAPDTSTVSVNSTDVRRAQLSLAPSDIRKVMGSQSAKKVTINGEPLYSANVHETQSDNIIYRVNFHHIHPTVLSLVDNEPDFFSSNPSNSKLDSYNLCSSTTLEDCPNWSWDMWGDVPTLEEEITFVHEEEKSHSYADPMSHECYIEQVKASNHVDFVHQHEHLSPFFDVDLPPIKPPPEPDP